MKKTRSIFYVVSLFVFIASVVASSAFAETTQCTECGMMVDMNSKFTARIVTGNTTSYFCDIGDLFSYLKRTGTTAAGAGVKDYTTGEWLAANKAFYVKDDKKFKTPMGWGIAAFKEKAPAAAAGAVLDFDSTAKTLK
jgi:nitrous oxide reductase accessory protein NosL